MMTKKDIKETYTKASSQTSDIARKLCLTGIGVAWLFNEDKYHPFPGYFYCAVVFFVIALFLDFVQYLYKTVAWKWELNKHPGLPETAEVEPWQGINVVTWICFLVKSAGCITGYIFLMLAMVMHH